jgi:hypothetical protein
MKGVTRNLTLSFTVYAKNYRCPARMPATIEIMKSVIMPITMIFFVEVFI